MAKARTSRTLLIVLTLALAAPCFGGSIAPIKNAMEAGRYQQALKLSSRAMRSNPGDRVALLLHAEALQRLGRGQEAVVALRQLIADHPDFTEAYNNLAVLYAEGGDLDRARETLEKGIQADKTYATMHSNLTRLYEQMAQEAYGKALDLKSRTDKPDLVALLDVQAQPAKTAPTEPLTDLSSATYTRPKPQRPATPSVVVAPPAEPEPVLVASTPKIIEPLPDPPDAVESAAEPTAVAAPPRAETPPRQRAAARSEPAVAPARAVSEAAAAGASRTVGPIRRLLGWGRAWTAQDPDAYIRFYTGDYQPDGMSRKAWIAQRRSRLTKPQWIKVELNEFRAVTLDDDRVQIDFRQLYRSDRFSSRVRKRVIMVNEGDGWVIEREKVTARE